ncbi:MAG: glycerophosphodiester phosphodiesterase family protein [bacterium]
MEALPRPLLLGHRGAAGEAPENTWPAFEAARRAGMHGFEIDVLLTSDGVPAVIHDLTLTRLFRDRKAVRYMSFADLCRLDVGSHFHPRFAGEKVPRLEDVLDRYGDMVLDVEIKELNPFSERLAEMVIELVKERGIEDRIIISSFNPVIIRKVQRLEPGIRTGFNYISDSILHLRRAWFGLFAHTFSKHPQPGQVTRRYLGRQHRKGIRVIPWGVNHEADALRLLAMGADGLISDFPGMLRRIMDRG